tara:strand:+ start:188 stop:1783 length:1596 start_codon:yes stop_codon:yes gene_type:complete
MDYTDCLNKKMNRTQDNFKEYIEQEENEIDLKKVFNTLKRSKKLITGFILGASLISSYKYFKATPIWSGSFNIVVKEDPSNKNGISGGFNPIFNLSKINDNNETQKLILKSQSVLMPVFNYVKKYKEEKGSDTEKFFFNNWIDGALKIDFEARSSVLKVEYFSNDKKLIIDTLNLISTKYQSYSKQETEKQITKSIKYLEEQEKIMKDRSRISTKKFNEFSINNGLGNIDGFVGLGNSTALSYTGNFGGSNLNNNQTEIKLGNSASQANSDSAGIRFSNQFKLLQNYEAKLVDLSAKLKPNSKTMIDLRLRIDNLREELKRPNEILLKYNDLKKEASRNEGLLANIEGSLVVLKLNKIKTPDPWELISEPTLVNKPIYRNRLIFFITPIFVATILVCIISIIREKLSGKIFEKDDFKKLIRYEYLDALFKNNSNLNENIICSSLGTVSKEKIGLVNLDNLFLEDKIDSEIKFANNKDFFKLITLKNIKELTNYNNIILAASPGKISKLNLNLIDKYLLPYKKKIRGWFFFE